MNEKHEMPEEEEFVHDPKNILEVRDLKKHFLIRKEWKLVSEQVPVKAEEGGDPPVDENGAPLMETRRRLQYKKTYTRAVDGVSFDVPYGKTLGIVGESGCGKSTMGRSILRLHEITAGKVYFEGKDITTIKGKEMRALRPQMQIVFQDPYSSLPPRMPVGEIIGEAVKVHGIVPRSEYRDYVISVMRKCGLQDFYFDRYPHEFSGGQRQRICIARALALNPKFVVCDEPVSALDVSIQAQIVNLLKELQENLKLTYMFISHDLRIIKHFCDRVMVMYLGNIVELGTREAIYEKRRHPYTKALLSAIPDVRKEEGHERILLTGDIPSPVNPPSGCPFHPRCSYCMDICRKEKPKLRSLEDGTQVACHLEMK